MAEGSGLIKRFYDEVVADGNLDRIEEFVSPDVVNHEEGVPGQPPGVEGVRFFVSAMREGIPDIRPKESEPTLAEGDLEAARTVLTGTHDGELMGVAPTGKMVEFETIDIIRVEDGKVVEHWGVTDVMALMQQVGAVPASA